MKKSTVFILLAAMVIMLFLPSCKKQSKVSSSKKAVSSISKSQTESESTGESSEEVSESRSSLPSNTANSSSKDSSSSGAAKLIKDLKGYKYNIAVTSYNEPVEIALGASDYIDAVYLRNKKLEQQYNIKISYEYYEPATFYETARKSIMAGEKFADLICAELFSLNTMYLNNCLSNLAEVPNLKLSSPVWIKEFTTQTTFLDGTYGINSKGLNISQYSSAMAVHYNKTLLQKLKLTDPAEHINKGTWTWDTFRELMLAGRSNISGGGTYTDRDRWGCTSAGPQEGIAAFFASSGVKAVIKDSSGKLIYNLKNSEAAQAMSKLSEILTSKDGAFFNSTDVEKHKELYRNEQSLFYIGRANDADIEALAYEDAVVPIPLYKKGGSYIAATSFVEKVLTMPRTVKDKAGSGLIFQAMAEAAEAEYEIYMETEIAPRFKGDSSVDMIKRHIEPGLRIDMMNLVRKDSLPIYNATLCAIANPILNNTQKASDLIDGYGPATQELLDQLFNSRKK